MNNVLSRLSDARPARSVRIGSFLFAACSVFFLLGCLILPEQKPEESKTEKTIDVSFNGVDRIFTFDHNYDYNTFRFSGLSGQSVILVKSNASDSVVLAENTGSVASARSLVDDSDSMFPSPSDPRACDIPAGTPIRIDRTPRTRVAQTEDSSRSVSGLATVSSDYVPPVFNVGSIKDFSIYEDSDMVSAVLRTVGEHCAIWVPADHMNTGETDDSSNWKTNDNLVNLMQCKRLAQVFDSMYPLVRNAFGYKIGGGPDGDGGIDKDKRIHILIYDIDADTALYKGEPRTGGVFGYYCSDNSYNYSYSNKCEMFYIDAHFTDFFPDVMYSTLVHEFQHMIYQTRKGTSSPDWFNEMLSMLTEDFMQCYLEKATIEVGESYDVDFAGPVEGRFPLFNSYYEESGVTDWLQDKDNTKENETLFSYSSEYAFGAYLARNYGGIRLVAEMARNSTTGKQSVTDALNACGFPNESFETVLLVTAKPWYTMPHARVCLQWSASIRLSDRQNIRAIPALSIPSMSSMYLQYPSMAIRTIKDLQS